MHHDGEFTACGAALPWSPGRLPIALAGRGPRTERLAAERADRVLLAGKAVDAVPDLVPRLRAGPAHPPVIAWNPGAAWTRAMIEEIRSHLAYMTIDLPPEERHGLGVDDALAGRLRETVAALGPEAAGPLVPDAVLQRYAVTGSREAVVARIAALRALVRPELLLFDAGDYSAAYLKSAAAVITQVGASGRAVAREPMAGPHVTQTRPEEGPRQCHGSAPSTLRRPAAASPRPTAADVAQPGAAGPARGLPP